MTPLLRKFFNPRFHFSWVITLLSFHFTLAQSADRFLDSLITLLEKQPQDTVYVNAQLMMADHLLKTGNYQQALISSHDARRVALRLAFATGIGRSWLTSGQIYYKKNEYDSAANHLRKALAIFNAIDDKERQGLTYLAMGQVLDYQARYSEALLKYNEALSRFITLQNKQLIAHARNYSGNTHFNLGNYEIALDHYLKAYRTGQEGAKEKQPYLSPLNNIGVVYALMEQYDEALKYFLLYLEVIASQPEKKHGKAGVLLNIGECYSELNDVIKAQHYLNLAVSLQNELGDKRGLALSFSNLAETYRKQNDPKTALKYYQESIQLARTIKNQEVLLHPLIGATKLHLQEEKTTDANATISEALQISRRIHSKVWEEKALLLASQLESLKENHANAMRLFKRYHTLHDSLFNDKRSKQVIQIRELYEAEKKQQEINLLTEARKFEELKGKNERTLFLVFLTFLAFVVAASAYWALTKTRDSHILKQQKDTIGEANNELKKLLDQIEQQNKTLAAKNEILEELHREKDGLIGIVAHDLRSPLTQITGLSTLIELSGDLNPEQKDLVKNIKTVCGNGNTLIQDLLDINHFETTKKLDQEPIELTQFLPTLFENYLPAIRKKELTLHYEYDRSKRATIVTDKECLVRIFDNLITNAIKFSPPGLDVFVKLDLNAHDVLILSIQDRGPGFSEFDKQHLFKKFKKLSARPTAGEPSTGLGLSIVKSLVDRLNATIEVKSQQGKGAEIKLSFQAKVHHRTAEPVI